MANGIARALALSQTVVSSSFFVSVFSSYGRARVGLFGVVVGCAVQRQRCFPSFPHRESKIF